MKEWCNSLIAKSHWTDTNPLPHLIAWYLYMEPMKYNTLNRHEYKIFLFLPGYGEKWCITSAKVTEDNTLFENPFMHSSIGCWLEWKENIFPSIAKPIEMQTTDLNSLSFMPVVIKTLKSYMFIHAISNLYLIIYKWTSPNFRNVWGLIILWWVLNGVQSSLLVLNVTHRDAKYGLINYLKLNSKLSHGIYLRTSGYLTASQDWFITFNQTSDKIVCSVCNLDFMLSLYDRSAANIEITSVWHFPMDKK